MKKFLKVSIITLLVLGVIGGTTFFFFKKIEKENNTTESIVNVIQSESQLKFDESLQTTANAIYEDGDDRLNLIIATNKNLDEIVYTLLTYHIENKTKISSKEITSQLVEVKNSRQVLMSMLNEFNIKVESSSFDKHLGVNDLYLQACSYLTDYADLANMINQRLKVDRASDIKFNMFEIYANVVINTFSNTTAADIDTTKEEVEISNSSNIDVMNSVLKIRNSFVVTIENEGETDEVVTPLFTANNNMFNKCYQKCDKESFAENLAENLELATNPIQPTKERVATYYFNLIYGI